MRITERIQAFAYLGKMLQAYVSQTDKNELDPEFESLQHTVDTAFGSNGWFEKDQIIQSIGAIAGWLEMDKLESWLTPHSEQFTKSSDKVVGIIMAGNIPLVGFHDLLSVLLAGFRVQVKLSSDDKFLLPALMNLIQEAYPDLISRITYVEQLKDIDAIIATGSNNSSRYFENYFSKYPHIIRKNRTSVAILNGKEKAKELESLGEDIFSYFGLGCRNVSKIYVPQNYKIDKLFKAVLPFSRVMQNKKYMNNYSYHKTLYLMNQEQILDNEFLIIKEDDSLHSPVGTLFVKRYKDIGEVKEDIAQLKDDIQCVVGEGGIEPGTAQKPGLSDYADNVNTLEFLAGLPRS